MRGGKVTSTEQLPLPPGTPGQEQPVVNGEDTAPVEQEKAKFSLSDYEYKTAMASGAIKQRLVVPEGRPAPDAFFRIDPRPHMRKMVATIVYKPEAEGSGDLYLVSGALVAQAEQDLSIDNHAKLVKRVKPAMLKVCICRPRIIRLWALKIPLTEGRRRPNGYTQSAWDASEQAEKMWVRIEQNESETGYDIEPSVTQWPDPEWPTETLDELAEKAYPGRFITSFDHEIWKKIRGED